MSTDQFVSELSERVIEGILARLVQAQYPSEWRVNTSAPPADDEEEEDERVVLVDRLPEGASHLLDTDDEADEVLLEDRSEDEMSDGEGGKCIDNGSDLEDFIASDDDEQVDEDDEVSVSSDSGSDSGSDDDDAADEDVDLSVEEVEISSDSIGDAELAHIDVSNIVAGTRSRRPPVRFVPANYSTLMLRGDDSVEGSLEDSDDDEASEEDESEDEDADKSESEAEEAGAEDAEDMVIHKTPSNKRPVVVETDSESESDE